VASYKLEHSASSLFNKYVKEPSDDETKRRNLINQIPVALWNRFSEYSVHLVRDSGLQKIFDFWCLLFRVGFL